MQKQHLPENLVEEGNKVANMHLVGPADRAV